MESSVPVPDIAKNQDNLSTLIIEDLQKSGLNNKTIEEMQIEEIKGGKDGANRLKNLLGFSCFADHGILQAVKWCYAIPYQHLQIDFGRVKLDAPLNGAKYLAPKKDPHLYFLPQTQPRLSKVVLPLLITEGEKKVAKLTQDAGKDYAVIGFPGVAGFHSYPEWKDIRRSGRKVIIFYDDDFKTNSDVAYQLLSLYVFLWKKKALPAIAVWQGAKGIDDFLVMQQSAGKAPTAEIEKLIGDATTNPFELISLPVKILADCLAVNHFKRADTQAFHDEYKLKKLFSINFSSLWALIKQGHRDKKNSTKKKEDIEPWYHTKDTGEITIFRGLCAEAFFNQRRDDLLFAQEAFWQFEKVWASTPDSALSATIRFFIKTSTGGKPITATILRDVMFQVGLISHTTIEFDTEKDLIALQNGVLNTDTFQLLPYKREYRQTIILPFSYLPDKTAPEWNRFLQELEFQQNTLDRLQEWAGYCLTTETRIEKCLFFHGDGANGKSVFLETLVKMLGNNCSAIEPSELTERFQLLRIRGKLVNCCSDISTSKVFSEKFKNVVSGEFCESDVKHKDAVTFRPFAKHLFSANNLIVTKDRSNGFYRRFDVLHFTKTFDEETRDEGLKHRIWENELAGVFNWALTGLQRLKKNKWKLTPSSEFQAAHDEFKRESNPVQMFIEENYENLESSMETSAVPWNERENQMREKSINVDVFRDTYVAWCSTNGYMPLTSVHLGREVARLGYEKKRLSCGMGIEQRRYHVYYGLIKQ